MNGTDSSPTAKAENKEKFRMTLQALTQLEGVVEKLEQLTNKLCGSVPPKEPADDKMREVNTVALLLSDTPDRIARIEADIATCIDRLRSELD